MQEELFLAFSGYFFLTWPSSLCIASVTLPMGQSLWWAPSSFIRTMSPSVKFRLDDDHFLLGYMFCKYSCLHQSQSWSVRYCAHLQRQQAYRSVPTKTPGGMPAGSAFIVKSMEGKSGCSLAMLVGTKAMVRALTITVTSAIRVMRSLWGSWALPSSANMASSRWWIVPICRSHAPPKCEACWPCIDLRTAL